MGRILRTCLRRTSLKQTIPWLRALAIAALLMDSLAHGQVAPAASPTQQQTVVDVLHQLSDKADVVFAGQVVAIRRPNDTSWVEVEFRVDQAIRGCSVGTPYVLREWAGLWTAGNQRYRVGQRLLMLLHAPSASGMSSPVGGLDGAMPIRQGGMAAQAMDSSTAPQLPFVDLRWLGARLPHVVSYRSEPAPAAKPDDLPLLTQPTAHVAASGSVIGAAPITAMPGNVSASDVSVPAQQASVDAVIGMLTTWQKAQHVAP
jgi:hypothetical protein